jgi:D-erythrulose 4-kinase
VSCVLNHPAQFAGEMAEGTAGLVPRAGHARTHAEKRRGTPDAGAVSLALGVTAVAPALAGQAAAEGG